MVKSFIVEAEWFQIQYSVDVKKKAHISVDMGLLVS
jgi:hypothetical protein